MKGRVPHRQIYRIIEGAVINTLDAHPNWPAHPRMITSVAKRAAGTLAATWPSMLAVETRSDRSDATLVTRPASDGHTVGVGRRESFSHRKLRMALKRLHTNLGALAAQARLAGQDERFNALVDALRLVGEMRKSHVQIPR
jgi:hypothetical protein